MAHVKGMENHTMDTTVDGISKEIWMFMCLSECDTLRYLFIHVYERIEDNSCSMLAIMAFRVSDTYCKGVKIIQALRYSNSNFKTLVPIERSAFLDSCKSNHQDVDMCYLC